MSPHPEQHLLCTLPSYSTKVHEAVDYVNTECKVLDTHSGEEVDAGFLGCNAMWICT
jgi:hypothetical protein